MFPAWPTSRSRVLLEKLIILKLAKQKFPYSILFYLTLYNKVPYLPLSWTTLILFTPSKYITLRSVLVLFSQIFFKTFQWSFSLGIPRCNSAFPLIRQSELYILINQQAKLQSLYECYADILKIASALNFFVQIFWMFSVVSRHLNFVTFQMIYVVALASILFMRYGISFLTI